MHRKESASERKEIRRNKNPVFPDPYGIFRGYEIY